MAKKNKNASSGSLCRFEFQSDGAQKVCVAGSFNHWRPGATPMVAVGGGLWAKELTLPPGRYEYRFVVEGKWTDDPNAKEVAHNPHGGINAVLTVV